MHVSNEEIERWSTKIREACAKHADYLADGQDGIHGYHCCARGAVAFDPEQLGGHIDLNDVLVAIAVVSASHASQSVIDFLTGVASGFDDQAYLDENDETEEYEKGQVLGAEMRAKYITEVKP